MRKKFIAIIILGFITSVSSLAGTIKFSLPASSVYKITDTEAGGYDALYVVSTLNNVSLSYVANSASAVVSITGFTDHGEASAVTVPFSSLGDERIIANPKNQTSYTFIEGAQTLRIRLIDYSQYTLQLKNLSAYSLSNDCDNIKLACEGAAEIKFYNKFGIAKTLSRSIKVSYNALIPNADNTKLESRTIDKVLPFISSQGSTLPTPYMATRINVEGDRFSRYLSGHYTTASTELKAPSSVIGVTSAVRINSPSTNSKKNKNTNGSFGGSAPVEISFTADVNEAATYLQWQVSEDKSFKKISYTYPYKDFTESFINPGTVYVRFYATDNSGECTFTGDVYTINIGESSLECPNAFSPNNDGVNDVWKVSYQSITEFDCSIFARSGRRVAHFTDPADGWDGKINGKTAPSGVYYYVITAKGTDGKSYKLSGDINIINYR